MSVKRLEDVITDRRFKTKKPKKKPENQDMNLVVVVYFTNIMAGNIKSTSLLFVLEYLKHQIITGAELFNEEVIEDD